MHCQLPVFPDLSTAEAVAAGNQLSLAIRFIACTHTELGHTQESDAARVSYEANHSRPTKCRFE
jgi:hypothetical protein